MSGAVCALDVRSVSKSYGATVALQDVSIELRAGEVHALLGENGAGKSTLVKILSGVVKPNVGTMRIDGEPYEPRSIVDARRRGVATAFQELSLVPNLTVAQNLSLPRQAKGRLGLVSGAATQKQGAAILKRFGLRLSPSAIVAGLTLAERQRLEITRAFACNPKVLILDEPTAALAETDWLFGLVRQATAAGAAVLYISHRLAEVRELCQRATVLRNGRSIGTVGLEDATDHNIFEMMVGRGQAEEMQRRAASRTVDAPRCPRGRGIGGREPQGYFAHAARRRNSRRRRARGTGTARAFPRPGRPRSARFRLGQGGRRGGSTLGSGCRLEDGPGNRFCAGRAKDRGDLSQPVGREQHRAAHHWADWSARASCRSAWSAKRQPGPPRRSR